MDNKNHQTFQRIARKTARFFAHRCWWADPNELQSEAYLSLMEFYANPPPTFDPSHVQSRNYAGTVASRHMSRWCFAQQSPVSAPPRAHRQPLGPGHQRAAPEVDTRLLTSDLESEVIALEAAALVPELHAQLRERLSAIYVEMFPDQPLDVAEACIDVLAENVKSFDAANEHSVDVRDVYRRTERLKTRACRDFEVRHLLTKICTHRRNLHDYRT